MFPTFRRIFHAYRIIDIKCVSRLQFIAVIVNDGTRVKDASLGYANVERKHVHY